MNVQQITIYIGQHDISRKRSFKKLIRKASDVIIYDTYARGKDDRNDLALVELADPIRRFSKTVMPACLPPDDEFQDNNIEAFVAGWGMYNLIEFNDWLKRIVLLTKEKNLFDSNKSF